VPQTGITNAEVIARMFRRGARTRQELADALGLGKASAARIVERLLKAGHLREGEKLDAPGPGRKTTAIHIRPDLACVVGADLEGRAVRACVLDCARGIAASGRKTIGSSWSMRKIASTWLGLIEQVIRESGAARSRIAGLGVGLPGMVSRNARRIHAYLPPGRWVDFDIGSSLDALGLPVAAANNALCVAEYERRAGAAADASSFISIIARYGIGAAVCARGSFLEGENTFIGEFGHTRIDMNGPKCVCGRRGCLDVYASGRTLPAKTKRRGKAWAAQLSARGACLAVAMANLLKVCHSPLMVLNGIYNDYEDQARPVLERSLADELTPLGIEAPELVFGEPSELKSSIGAAYRAADAFLQQHLAGRMR
jgi:predicted NBD/HSP70 family sugar kinase